MDKVLSIFKALSDGNRLRIVAALMAHEELCACQLIELLQVTGATCSRHLSKLVSAGLLQSRKDGRWVYYSLKDNSFTGNVINDWIKEELSTSPEIKNDSMSLQNIISQDREELCRKQRGDKCCPA